MTPPIGQKYSRLKSVLSLFLSHLPSEIQSLNDKKLAICSQGLHLKFQGAIFDAIKISRNKILVRISTGSEPEMTSADHISDCLGVLGIRLGFRLHNSIHQFRVLGTRNLPNGDAPLGRKKDDATVKDFFFLLRKFPGFWPSNP